MPSPAIEIRGLRKTFPRFTLGPLDLTVPMGSIYGLVGRNGAGKSTTIDLIFGIGGKDAGSIAVLGLDHRRDEVAMKRQVGYVSPDLSFQTWGRVRKAIRFVRGFYPTWDEAYCARLMTLFKLDGQDRIATLSTGARIKLTLLLAMAWRPRVLVLDEPTVGLDAVSKREVFQELLALVGEGDRSVLIASHGLTDLERFADHVGIIENGRLVLESPMTDLVERFSLVDVVVGPGVSFEPPPGSVVQERLGERCRVLFDGARASVEDLRRAGGTVVAQSALTLEELFIALDRQP